MMNPDCFASLAMTRRWSLRGGRQTDAAILAFDIVQFEDATARIMKKLNPEYVKAVMAMANDSPYFRHLGMAITELGVGEALVEIGTRDAHRQMFGHVHGGVIASLVDTAIFWCFFGELDESAGITTVDLKVNYLAPVANGKLSARENESAWAAPWDSARRKSSTARANSSPTAPRR